MCLIEGFALIPVGVLKSETEIPTLHLESDDGDDLNGIMGSES